MVHKVNSFTVESYESHEALKTDIKKPETAEALALKGNEGIRADHPHTCCICGKVFTCRSTLRLHLNIVHLKTKKFCCDHCPKFFFAKTLIVSHLKTSHGQSKQRQETSNETKNLYKDPHTCGVCQKMFKGRGGLRKHLEIFHVRSKTFACNLCPKFYFDKYILRKHMKTHGVFEDGKTASDDLLEPEEDQ